MKKILATTATLFALATAPAWAVTQADVDAAKADYEAAFQSLLAEADVFKDRMRTNGCQTAESGEAHGVKWHKGLPAPEGVRDGMVGPMSLEAEKKYYEGQTKSYLPGGDLYEFAYGPAQKYIAANCPAPVNAAANMTGTQATTAPSTMAQSAQTTAGTGTSSSMAPALAGVAVLATAGAAGIVVARRRSA